MTEVIIAHAPIAIPEVFAILLQHQIATRRLIARAMAIATLTTEAVTAIQAGAEAIVLFAI